MTKDQFMVDNKTQSSVLYQITIIGEAARRLSGEFRDRHSDIPWHLITGMRNKLIHEYDDVDLHEVWKTIKDVLDQMDVSLFDDPMLPLTRFLLKPWERKVG